MPRRCRRATTAGAAVGTAASGTLHAPEEAERIQIYQKTKMCKFHVMGMCAKGDACLFAHHRSELNALPDLSRTKLCRALINTGQCTDPWCTYAHSGAELRQAPDAHGEPAKAAPKAAGQNRRAPREGPPTSAALPQEQMLQLAALEQVAAGRLSPTEAWIIMQSFGAPQATEAARVGRHEPGAVLTDALEQVCSPRAEPAEWRAAGTGTPRSPRKVQEPVPLAPAVSDVDKVWRGRACAERAPKVEPEAEAWQELTFEALLDSLPEPPALPPEGPWGAPRRIETESLHSVSSGSHLAALATDEDPAGPPRPEGPVPQVRAHAGLVVKSTFADVAPACVPTGRLRAVGTWDGLLSSLTAAEDSPRRGAARPPSGGLRAVGTWDGRLNSLADASPRRLEASPDGWPWQRGGSASPSETCLQHAPLARQPVQPLLPKSPHGLRFLAERGLDVPGPRSVSPARSAEAWQSIPMAAAQPGEMSQGLGGNPQLLNLGGSCGDPRCVPLGPATASRSGGTFLEFQERPRPGAFRSVHTCGGRLNPAAELDG